MLNERAMQLDAEQESTGQPSIWREVYNLMRCPGPPCHLGPHCWRDPIGKKHYKLRTHHLRALIKYVEQGNVLHCQDDVPEDVQQQLYAEHQQNIDRKQPTTTPSPLGMTPITINNHFPDQFQAVSVPALQNKSISSNQSPNKTAACNLEIPGHRDVAVKEYSEWQQLQVQDVSLKKEVRNACNVVLAEGLDLEQLHQDQDCEFLINKGVKRGIARRFVGDIESWVRRLKQGLD